MIGKPNHRRFVTSQFNLHRFLRWLLVIILYLVTFSALDNLTNSLEIFPGVVAWYPPDGLSLAFLLTFGAGLSPVFALASLISSIIIYRFSIPFAQVLLWAVILSTVYGINAYLLRRKIRIDPQLKNLRDILWLILSSAIVSTFLALLSVSFLVTYNEIPASQFFNALAQWWIGEMIGVLVFAPFFLIHVMPRVKRFIDVGWTKASPSFLHQRPTLLTFGQIISIPVVLYLAFGIPSFRGFHPFYLIAAPIIWIALTNGLSGASIAIAAMNFGTIIAIWLFKIDASRLGELQFLMFSIYISTLLTGAIVTKQKKTEEDIITSNAELSMLFELSHSLVGADNLDDVLYLVNCHAVESIHTTFSRIALLEEGTYTMRAAYPIRPLEHDLRIAERIPTTSIPYAHRILEQNEPMIVQASETRISNMEKEILLLNFAQTLCIIPLRISDSTLKSVKLMGLLMLGEARNEGREPFTTEKLRLAQTIGSSAAIAIRRMLLRDQTELRLQQLVALSEIDQAIISSSDMVYSLKILLSQVMEQLKVDAADVLLFNPTSQTLEFVAGRGFQTTAFENTKQLHLGEGYAGRAAIERRTIHIPNLGANVDNPRLVKALKFEPFLSYYAVPLIVKNQLKGVLELFHRTELESNEEWVNFLHALANQAAIAIDNSSLFNDLLYSNTELTQAYDATIQGWSRALDLRDKETEGHTQRVTELTIKLCRQFGLSDEKLVHIRYGALLHDIGKMGVPDGILLKPGPLTDEEWVVMRMHPTYTYELLSPIVFLRPAIDIPYCHHEKWDGTGYPRGLKGDKIPLEARIFAVVDVWDALTSDRPYRAAWSEEKTLDHIRSQSGTHFDPQVVKICLDSGLLQGHPKMSRGIEPFLWNEKFSVGVRELDQQHQQLFKLVNRLISATGTISTHTETISEILGELNIYGHTHFTTEERLMDDYGYPGLEEQKVQHNDFLKKTTDFIENAAFGDKQTPEVLLNFLTNWLVHHILEDDMAYRSFFREKGVE